MGRKSSHLALLSAVIFSVCLIDLQAQNMSVPSAQPKKIAITIDDLVLNGPHIEVKRLRKMTEKLLAGINKYQIPVVGFVNESLLYVPDETDERIAILKAWSEGGVELGNHTFSHLRFKDISLAEYEDDFIRGEAFTRMLLKEKGQKIRYFRHPFLQMGGTAEMEKSFEEFLAARGYTIAPVTIDILDWMFLHPYAQARNKGDTAMIRRVSDEYLKFAELKFDYCEKLTAELFGRQIRQILLLHANELTADNFDRLVRMIKNRGYQFITLEQALKDPVYRFPDQYTDSSDWLLHWSVSKGKKIDPPQPSEFIQQLYRESQKVGQLPR